MEAESSKMGAARATRSRKKRKSDITAEENDTDYKEVHKIKRKRGTAGKLAVLVDLPIDILFEVSIFSYISWAFI